MTNPAVHRRRGSFGPTVLLGLAGSGLAALAGSRDWATASGDAAGIKVHAAATGSQAAPLATALALVALAAWGVVLVARGRVRRLVALVGAAAALGVLIAVVYAWDGARDAALAALAGKHAGDDVASASRTAWYYLCGVGGLLTLVSSAVAVVVSPAWPAMGSKYDAPGAGTQQPANRQPVTEQEMWRALDQGHDPTS